jgi:hypothetical protein
MATRRAALVAAAFLLIGCGLGRPTPLDLPPGHRAVLGRIEIARFEAPEALLEIVREDGTYRHDLPVGLGPRDFVIGLPPGRYRVRRLTLTPGRFPVGTSPLRELTVGFEVGSAPAVYIGTLRLTGDFGGRIETRVTDQYEETVPALRARHPDIGTDVARSLMTGG